MICDSLTTKSHRVYLGGSWRERVFLTQAKAYLSESLFSQRFNMHPKWNELIHSRSFWLWHLSAGIDLAKHPTLQTGNEILNYPMCFMSLRLSFSMPEHYRLSLEISGDETLELELLGEDPFRIGNMDCHQMSDVFRWEEFRAIIRHLSSTNQGPEWANELLLGFYVAVTEDCLEEHLAMFRRSAQASQLFTDEEISYMANYIKKVHLRKNLCWVNDPTLGWIAEVSAGSPSPFLYSLRQRGTDFNFAEFRKFMQALGV